MLYWLQGKRVLVTGGTGSIGSELVRQVLQHNPEVVRVFSRDEAKQMYLAHSLNGHPNVRYLIGDVRDRQRLRRAMEDVDVVIHAAAMKHVTACEYNPFEAIKTNVLGVQNVIDTALEVNAERVVAISTDKVANPANTMGATKLLAERLVAAANFYRGRHRTIFTAVRFGNVLGSRGSVVPIFKSQIEAGGPVTLTDQRATRFMMSIHQAVSLALGALTQSVGGEIFILKMPVVRVADLARAIIDAYAPVAGRRPEEIEIQVVGLRPGEKVHEELLTETEAERAYENDRMFLLPPDGLEGQPFGDAWRHTERKRYSSGDELPLAQEEIRELLKANGLLERRLDVEVVG